MKTVPVHLKKLSDVVDNEVVKITKFNTLKPTVNTLEKKILGATSLIHINQYNTDKQNLEKVFGDVDKKLSDTSGLVTATVSNTKTSEKKIPDTSGLVIATVFHTKINKVREKFLIMLNILLLLNLISQNKTILQQYYRRLI